MMKSYSGTAHVRLLADRHTDAQASLPPMPQTSVATHVQLSFIGACPSWYTYATCLAVSMAAAKQLCPWPSPLQRYLHHQTSGPATAWCCWVGPAARIRLAGRP